METQSEDESRYHSSFAPGHRTPPLTTQPNQYHSPPSQPMTEHDADALRTELVQVAAVAVAWLEGLE